MKPNNNTLTLITILTIAFIFTSCKKDKEDPTITISSPADHSEYHWGDMVHIEAKFEDDQALKNYTVMVGDADGNHLDAIDFMESGSVDNATYDFHEHFEVPADAPMMAWVYFEVTDAEGKTATMKRMLHFEE